MKKIVGPFQLKLYNGAIALIGEGITSTCQQLHVKLPSFPLHITLLSAAEYKLLEKPPLCDISIQIQHIYILSSAAPLKSNVQWLPVVWNHANVWRKSNGLPSKSFHVTLSETNNHSIEKSVSSYITSSGKLEKVLEEAIQIDVDALDHLFVSLRNDHTNSTQVAEKMICTFPHSYKGYLRLADSVIATNPKLAALSYAQSLAYDPTLVESVSRRIRKLSNCISYGPIATANEMKHISTALHDYLFRPWVIELDVIFSQMLWTAPTMSRERNFYLGYQLARFFSWIYPSRIAGMSTPRHAGDIDLLIDMGFTNILTLTRESPLDPAWFHMKPIQHLYVSIRNYGAPTLEEMDTILELVSKGGTWLVHCGGGVGRAGTVLACLMTMLGHSGVLGNNPQMDGRTAIVLLRTMRPNSLESQVQENFVSEFVSHRWKIGHAEMYYSEPNTKLEIVSSKESTLRNHVNADVIFMVGKPGSGKSWLASAIAKRRENTKIISQDDNGRAACEREISKNQLDDTLVILDRCNSKRKDRAEWLSFVPLGCRSVVIYFNYDTSLCRQRINRRLNHPTIRAGRGVNALDQMEREMESPNITEGFHTLLVISSFQAATEALILLTPMPPLSKFPRTPHLLNTGASGKDDIILSDFEKLTGYLTIEEKIDGANMGFSLDVYGAIQCQNRSHWVNAADHVQFKPLSKWLDRHGTELINILQRDSQFLERYILYGEWTVAKHSIHYTNLSDFFLAFDLYDRYEKTFVSRSVLTSALRGSNITQVPLLKQVETITRNEILEMVQKQSLFSKAKLEGVYVRFENKEKTQTVGRGKVVRSDFIAGNEHWNKANLILNQVKDSID